MVLGLIGTDHPVKFNFISKSCIFASPEIFETFNNRVCWTAPHPKWLCTYADSYMLAERVAPWTLKQSSWIFNETIAGFSQPSIRRLALDFTRCYQCLSGRTHLICRHIMYQHSAITETIAKQRLLSFICSTFNLGIAGFVSMSAILTR